MNDLIIEEKKDNLGITCSTGKINMSGNSLLPNAQKFFQPVLDWVDEYVKDPKPKTEVTLKFNYVDTASVQAIYNVLRKFREIPDYGERVIINWHFEFDDPEMLEIGEIMEGRLKLKFNFIEFTE
jgi:hypothetical protein